MKNKTEFQLTDEPLLPAAEILDLHPPRWIQIAEDLYVGASADRVFLKWRTEKLLNVATFGPRTWDRILRTIAAERKR